MTWVLPTFVLIFGGLLMVIALGIRQSTKAYEAFAKELIQDALSQPGEDTLITSVDQPPQPVNRYLVKTLGENQRPINHVLLKQVGMLRASPSSQKWLPFTATQLITQNPAAFIWDATIQAVPAVHIRVRDSYAHGIGSGRVSLWSTFPMGREENRPELNSGALYRYLAEAAWHPTILLPSSGIKWTPIDENRAVAALADAGNAISLEFRFNEAGDIISVFTKERFGLFEGKYEKHPWEGFFSDYQAFDGIRIPTRGEVGWHLPDGFWLFWKGEIVAAEFGNPPGRFS